MNKKFHPNAIGVLHCAQPSPRQHSAINSFHKKVEQNLTLAPFVDQQWRWFCVSRFDPRWEETPFVCLVPQVLVQVGVSNLLQWLHIIYRHQMTVQVHELYTNLEEKS